MSHHSRACAPLVRAPVLLACAVALACHPQPAASPAPVRANADSAHITAAVRVNQLGYLPAGRKVAVVCAVAPVRITSFVVLDANGTRAFGPAHAEESGAFGPCVDTYRLDFSALSRDGRYHIEAASFSSPTFPIGPDVYDGAADTLLYYMREQRSGYNPLFRDSVHTKDGIIVDDSVYGGKFVPVSGGWADASDYLQYVTTSATATFQMLMAYRDHPQAFSDHFDAEGLPGANGVPDILDEARHGLEWLARMYPNNGMGLMFNEIADDRDHTYWDLPTTDTTDYGWGKGGPRPVYPCTGRPQGLFTNKNRSSGYASTAGKFASAMALGSILLRDRDSVFADSLAERAKAAYALGQAHPGVCQTAPGHSPYFYEEDNWTDDMELGAAELYALTHEQHYLTDAVSYAAREPVTPWMGADTARHYEWYPWYNSGHHEVWRAGSADERRTMAEYYREGLARVVTRAHNGFRVGIPFIWCSNNLMASFATQAFLYRQMTGDTTYAEYENAALDWLFGTNPWGVSMVIGLPHSGTYPRDPHSVISNELHWQLTGGLVDGPVYRSIYQNLRGISLHNADEYAPFNTGFIVYHDDVGDYSTDEPIMDGTANLAYLLSALAGSKVSQ
ncbi:MAG TPA: glycoside hydrolase family 9 protein [Gemmatimonadaceae bacterium]|nr:glycoside hydrolase family 9 protein [Gemmatimonadaceae bacterium]